MGAGFVSEMASQVSLDSPTPQPLSLNLTALTAYTADLSFQPRFLRHTPRNSPSVPNLCPVGGGLAWTVVWILLP